MHLSLRLSKAKILSRFKRKNYLELNRYFMGFEEVSNSVSRYFWGCFVKMFYGYPMKAYKTDARQNSFLFAINVVMHTIGDYFS